MYKRIDYSKYKIIKDIYGDEYYLTDSRYSKEYDFTVLFGKSVITTPANASAIRTRELKNFILGTLDKPRKFLEPAVHYLSVTALRREFQANPYSTYRQWIKHGCKPEFVTFPDAQENPQTIFDYAGVEYVLYSAKKVSDNIIMFKGLQVRGESPKNKNPRYVITPELTQVIFNPDMTRAEKIKKLGIKPITYDRIANRKFRKTVHKIRFNYMVNNAHRFLSGSAEELYAEFKDDVYCEQDTISKFQLRASFIRNRMPGQKDEDPKFIQLLTDAAENPCKETRKKYMQYQSRISKSMRNLTDTYNILKQSGIWRKYEQLIEHDAERVQLDYVTSEREYIKDIRGKTYHVTDIKKDRIFGRIFFGKTRGVLNKRASVIVTEELAVKIKQLLGKSRNYFSSSILTPAQRSKVRDYVMSSLYSTLDDWIKDKNRPAMAIFKNRDNPQYVTDYFGTKWLVRRAEDIRGYFLLKGMESSKANERTARLSLILTSQIVEVIVKHRYDPIKANRILPIKNELVIYLRRVLGFNIRSDMVGLFAKNYRLLAEGSIEKIQKKLPFIKKSTIYTFRLRIRQINEMLDRTTNKDIKILKMLDEYYKTGDEKIRIDLGQKLGALKARNTRFAYSVMKQAGKIAAVC